MRITRTLLDKAAERGVLQPEQAGALWDFLTEQTRDTPSFRVTHILYYLGGMTAIGAMTLFMNLGWERLGGWGLFSIAIAYGVLGIALTEWLLTRFRQTIPAGITAAFVVALTPLAVYGLQAALGYWASGGAYRDYHMLIDWRWILMELATLAAGAIMLWRYSLPFLVMPVAATLWYMSMDLTPFLYGTDHSAWDHYKMVSLLFGLVILLIAFLTDMRSKHEKDYPFWLYLFGATAFWGGLSLMDSDSELSKFLYLCLNLLMIAIGAMLARRVFAVYGGLGVAGYLTHLAEKVFKDSMLFPVALTAIGLGIIYVGILWQRHEAHLATRLRALLPQQIRELVERRAV
jgi:hypothetical protein